MGDRRTFWIRRPGETELETYSLSGDPSGELGLLVHPFWSVLPTRFSMEKSSIEPEFTLYDKALPSMIDQSDYMEWVKEAIDAIRSGRMEKVVTWRPKVIPLSVAHPIEWFDQLCQAYPNAYVYLLNTPETGVWLGASPEKLVEVKDGTAEAMSLAGTRPLGSNTEWGQKERQEQEVVTRMLMDRFRDLGLLDVTISGPDTHPAGPVEHLLSLVKGVLPVDMKPESLVDSLHPTPAVGGFPIDDSLTWLKATELSRFDGWGDRELYGGYFGLVAKDEVEAFVNLRCMRVDKNKVVLFAGGGITAESDPMSEWQETENKLKTLLSVLHLENQH